MDEDTLAAKQNIHALGVSYLCSFLDRAGFTILEWNTVPDHHYQISARVNEKIFLIAVRTAYHPDSGTIESSTAETLVKEADERGALPHFASLSVLPKGTYDMEVGSVNEGQDYEVMFKGISMVRNSELLDVII